MKYAIPFVFHSKPNAISVEYGPMSDARSAGFQLLNLPFDPELCAGYPMLQASFDYLTLTGYERYCGWIQLIRREEYRAAEDAAPARILYELDVPDRQRGTPYFAVGYPPELFDAPCRNLRGCGRLVWRAFTYLVDVPSRMNGHRLGFLAGFSWGYTENIRGEVSLLDF